jgi:hypothetical protein
MVTTTAFSKDALNYAREVTRATPLQFVFVDGIVVSKYLEKGRAVLLDYFLSNSREVMAYKKNQPLPGSDDTSK